MQTRFLKAWAATADSALALGSGNPFLHGVQLFHYVLVLSPHNKFRAWTVQRHGCSNLRYQSNVQPNRSIRPDSERNEPRHACEAGHQIFSELVGKQGAPP